MTKTIDDNNNHLNFSDYDRRNDDIIKNVLKLKNKRENNKSEKQIRRQAGSFNKMDCTFGIAYR